MDRNPYSTMIPALPDLLSGRVRGESIARPVTDTFPPAAAPGVEPVQGTVTEIDLDARELTIGDQRHSWDSLIIATGSVPEYFGFPPDNLYTVDSLENARALRREFARRTAAGGPVPVLIAGAGYTGLEVAACLRLGSDAAGAVPPEITVVDIADTVLPFLPERDQQYIRGYLEKIGVAVRPGTGLTRYVDSVATLSDGTEIHDPLVIWSAGMRSSVVPIRGTVEYTRDGRLRTNSHLQLPGYPDVFVAGDAAAIEKGETVTRRAVNFAYYSGRCAGINAARMLSARSTMGSSPVKLKAFKPVDLGWVIPLGAVSVGHPFGLVRVRGKLGLRMHYAMSGFRHFGFAQAIEFYKTALNTGRAPEPPGPG